ncbi:hypothetical protein PV326_012845 [Microctonus aethiopoides]|nr:hypothetical protein PV326_012845 [Microctonus aethiopoides]
MPIGIVMWIVLRCDDADTQRATLFCSDYGFAMWTMNVRIFERWTNVNITKRDERRERQWYGYGHEMHGIRFGPFAHPPRIALALKVEWNVSLDLD